MPEGAYGVGVTEIGEYIRHNQCERRFKLGYNKRELANRLPFAARFYNPIDPVLKESGEVKENQLAQELMEAGFVHFTCDHYNKQEGEYPEWQDFIEALSNLELNQRAFAREVKISGKIGAFQVSGRIDFVLVNWKDNRPVLRVVEAKASRRDKTYHRLQAVLYYLLAKKKLETNSTQVQNQLIEPDELESSIVRIDQEQNKMLSILNTPALGDVSQEETDINRLLSVEGSIVRIINANLSELPYKIEAKCDGCVFSVHCLPESSLQRRLELLSLEPSDVRVLRENGVQTLDELAELDLTCSQARAIETNPSFVQNLLVLKTRASTRRSTLPRGSADPLDYQITQLPFRGYGQLPNHMINNAPLIRVFLAIDYDYVEDRIVALSGHVTSSHKKIVTRASIDDDGSWRFDPQVYEVDQDSDYTPLVDQPIVHFISSNWTGDYTFDSGVECGLITGFFSELVDRIAEVANQRHEAPIHFYVWSRGEITHLIEACSRVDTRLLSHLRELFGCRESLDQLIFSCLHDEVNRRYGLGWTGRGLSVVTSLSWFGQKYHWTRKVHGKDVWLESIFNQDIFDFKTKLKYHDDQTWADPNSTDPGVLSHTFELRSRFGDGLTVPYWHAMWRSLPNPDDPAIDSKTRSAIKRYNAARNPGYVRAFQIARIHALRWLEERIPKNYDIEKSPLIITELPSFSLNVGHTALAAIDFLRLENHVRRTDWISQHLVPPANRINSGETIPIRDVYRNASDNLVAQIHSQGYGANTDTIRVSSVFSEGSFVRITPCNQDPAQGQRLLQLINDGWTCKIVRIDWETEEIELSPIPAGQESRYVLPSRAWTDPVVFQIATIDSSVTDFVAKRVDEHLSEMTLSPIYDWFHPEHPEIPMQNRLTKNLSDSLQELLTDLILSTGHKLVENQIEVILGGLNSRIQLLQGPPGTGKTITTAISTLLRILARRRIGEIILVSANTHTALDNILSRIEKNLAPFRELCEKLGLTMPNITISKVHSSDPEDIGTTSSLIHHFEASTSRSNVRKITKTSVAIIGGTTSALLKMYRHLIGGAQFRNGFAVPTLMIDEASMLVFPHFLALSTLVSPNGEIMLTGDHRQLAPIVSHDWENEDRPPIIVYQPYKSAYEAIRDIARRNFSPDSVRMSALKFSFRLPPPLIELISRIYRLDNIDLQGLERKTKITDASQGGHSWDRIWEGSYGLFLILHNERQSRKYNQLEAEIIEQVVRAGMPHENDSIAILTPHRAQKYLLKRQLKNYFQGPVGIIDTVEHLQGDERSVVILSATECDASYINSNVGFILDLNRSNVAFSRAEDRLIVVCSEELINHIPADYDQYESTMLWKALRNVCSQLIAKISMHGKRVQIFKFEPPQKD